jgi:hypothetical protein
MSAPANVPSAADASNLIRRKFFHIDTVIKIFAHPPVSVEGRFLLKAERVRTRTQ